MFFRLRRAEIASAVPGCSTKNIITQRKFLRKFSEGRHMPRKRNFLKIFISFLKNRRKWGGVLFSPLCGQLSCRSCLETAARQEKPEGGSRGGPLHRHCVAEPPRRGSRGGRLSVCLKFFSKVNVTAPHQPTSLTASPPRGSLI